MAKAEAYRVNKIQALQIWQNMPKEAKEKYGSEASSSDFERQYKLFMSQFAPAVFFEDDEQVSKGIEGLDRRIAHGMITACQRKGFLCAEQKTLLDALIVELEQTAGFYDEA